jgi:FemAB-related protein (PEP-CTERM system-associated)
MLDVLPDQIPVRAVAPREADDTAAAVDVTTEVTEAEWDAFVRVHPDATGYHLWTWRQIFERALGHPTIYYAARLNGQVRAVLPTVCMRSRVFGNVLSSLPYVNYGGVLADDPRAAAALLLAAARTVEVERLSYLVLRHRTQAFPHLVAREHKVTMMRPLPGDSAALWDGLDRKVRNQVRKATKNDLAPATGGADLLDDFYRIFARNMRDLGTPVYGRGLFAEMLRAFPDDVRLHVVRLRGEVIAGAITYRYGGVIEVPSASSLREHRALCPNHLLYWHMIQWAIAGGARTFDFGRSTPGDGTYHFKEQWGATPGRLCWEYQPARGRAVPAPDRLDPKYQLAIAAWKQLPLRLSTWLGPRIARAVP